MISVVCVYSDFETLSAFLMRSLDAQTRECEFILIDNSEHIYSSAARALNLGGRMAKGEYIMFAHQDFRFSSNRFLEEAESMLDTVQSLGVAGLAGRGSRKGVLTHLTHGEPPISAGDMTFTDVIEVQTIDECLIVVPRDVFSLLEFDEGACDGWHLYAVDYALSVASLNLRVVVLPLAGYHKSSGYRSMTREYYRILREVVSKHKMNNRRIFTSMGNWSTRLPILPQEYANEIRRRLSRLIGMLISRLRCLIKSVV